MPLASSGILFCAVFLLTDAVRAVYFGGVFQEASSFTVGSLVFAITSACVLGYTYLVQPAQLHLAWSARGTVAKANLLTASSWLMYFFALQLIEPAVACTVFAGGVLMTMLVAARTGLVDEKVEPSGLRRAGYLGIGLALALLAATTLLGLSGFVRGSTPAAVAGLALAVGASVLIAAAIIVCKRLDRRGLTPLTQLGVRFLLYVLAAGALGAWGLDAKGALPASRLVEIVALGVVLTGIGTFAVHKALAALTSQGMGAAAAFGPCLVFALQLAEGRVDFTPWTLIGVCLYCSSALLVALSPLARLGAARGRASTPLIYRLRPERRTALRASPDASTRRVA